MDTVSFLSVETGKDLIVAFALMIPEDPEEIRSLILHRCPMVESVLDRSERGVRVTLELEDEDDDDPDMLDEVHWEAQTAIMRLKTRHKTYELDLRKVDASSISSMRKVLKKMNHDRIVRLSGI